MNLLEKVYARQQENLWKIKCLPWRGHYFSHINVTIWNPETIQLLQNRCGFSALSSNHTCMIWFYSLASHAQWSFQIRYRWSLAYFGFIMNDPNLVRVHTTETLRQKKKNVCTVCSDIALAALANYKLECICHQCKYNAYTVYDKHKAKLLYIY